MKQLDISNPLQHSYNITHKIIQYRERIAKATSHSKLESGELENDTQILQSVKWIRLVS